MKPFYEKKFFHLNFYSNLYLLDSINSIDSITLHSMIWYIEYINLLVM